MTKRERLEREGISSHGEIVALKKKFWQSSRNTTDWDVTLRFVTASGEHVESKQRIPFLAWSPPEVGGVLAIRYDPQNPKEWVDESR
jgi:hypothetical protein